MKTILLLLFTSLTIAQGDFKIESNKLIWQKVFDLDISKDDFIKNLKLSGNFYDIEYDSFISTNIKEVPIDYKASGYKVANTPMYISSSNIIGDVIIEFKEEKYRVTVSNIKLKGNIPNLAVHQTMVELKDYAVKNNEFKKAFKTKHYVIFDNQIHDMFKVVALDNW